MYTLGCFKQANYVFLIYDNVILHSSFVLFIHIRTKKHSMVVIQSLFNSATYNYTISSFTQDIMVCHRICFCRILYSTEIDLVVHYVSCRGVMLLNYRLFAAFKNKKLSIIIIKRLFSIILSL